jgi:hypothetical protein
LEDFFIYENVPGLNSISDELDSRLDIFLKLFIILYADDTVLVAESSSNLQALEFSPGTFSYMKKSSKSFKNKENRNGVNFPLVGPYFTWKIFRFLSIIK